VGSISLLSLTLYNFRSFCGKHVLTFPAKGLVILRGENRDSRGDSGAGKTNVLLALAYAFGYCRLSAKALQCWHDDDPMYVEVELDTPEGAVTVRRGIKGISIGKVKGRAAEAMLDKLCGVPTDLREILTYRSQVKPKKFLDMRDTALKQFLTQVLQLHGLEKEIDAASDLLDELEDKRKILDVVLDNAKKEAERREAELVVFEPESTHDLDAELGCCHVSVDKMKLDLERGRQELLQMQGGEMYLAKLRCADAGEHAAKLERQAHELRALPVFEQDFTVLNGFEKQAADAEKFEAMVLAADLEKRKAYDEDTERGRHTARLLHNELGRLPGLQDDIKRLTAEAEKLERDVCDRCERQWDNAKETLLGVQVELEGAKLRLNEIKAHRTRLAELDAWLAARAFAPDPRLERLATVKQTIRDRHANERRRLDLEEHKLYAERDAKVKELLAAVALERAQERSLYNEYLSDPQLPSKALRASQEALVGFLGKAETQLANLKGRVALVRQTNEAGLKRYNEQVKAVAAANTRLAEAQANADAAEAEWKKQSDYADLLKGFRNKIFDEVLEAISADATTIIGTLPNSQHISIDFQSERTTDKGTVQDKITPVTYLYGEPRDLEESVSGGQLTSIGLAVDLAVAGVISQRLGCNLGWVILDESFEGHDAITKLSCLEMLQAQAGDKLIIVVDHMSEIKGIFAKEIHVVFENKLSTLVQKAAA
jgi:hypothetical protein